jgi:hypothetical protein
MPNFSEILSRPNTELARFLSSIHIFAFLVPLIYSKALNSNSQKHKIFTQIYKTHVDRSFWVKEEHMSREKRTYGGLNYTKNLLIAFIYFCHFLIYIPIMCHY